MVQAAESGARDELLRRDGEFTLSRAGASPGHAESLKLAATSDKAGPHHTGRLEHELSLRDRLHPAWAAKPRALAYEHGHRVLLLDDPGGDLLARHLGQPWAPVPFLRVASGIATALGQAHAQGLIHRDIQPAHVLVEPTTGRAWLTGFGIASHHKRERPAPDAPAALAGTLAYMAPEQTGRMNRSVDARSDLYAMGVTLYQMLTGELPFNSTDAMDLVHCHIARQAMPPSERVAGVPAMVSAIVMKLLAKTAEDRYQTAAGAAADLQRCLRGLETNGVVNRFVLGGEDTPDVLRVPEKLYGREAEVATLLAAFERVVATGRAAFIVVSGYSGLGKSSLVNSLHKAIVAPRGLFASGKVDQYQRDIPYAALASALRALLRQLLAKPEAELSPWRAALREALASHGQLAVNVIPELELLVGRQAPVPELPPHEAQARFQQVFRRLLGVFARPEHPLALFIDDLQWLDAATLTLLEHLATHGDVRHLLVVGAYRDNEVTPTHPLVQTLQAIRRSITRLDELALRPLSPADVAQLVADALRTDTARVDALARLVHDKCGGNPFFAIQFFTALADDQLLVFDTHSRRWVWHIERMRANAFTSNVVEMMVGKLSRLPVQTQHRLAQLACLGTSASASTLARLAGSDEVAVHAALWEAVQRGLVLRAAEGYAFAHDRVQEGAYALLPEHERAATHAAIGRALLAEASTSGHAEDLDDEVFTIVSHFDRAAALVQTPAERQQVAALYLMAGRRARAGTAYAAARAYLAGGAALLAVQAEAQAHDLAFSLEKELGDCEFLTGDLAAADQRLTALAHRAGTPIEQAAVATSRVTLYTAMDSSDRAVATCLQFLAGIGIVWSPHPTHDAVQHEYQLLQGRIGSTPIEELIDLPLMDDPERKATIELLAALLPPAFFTSHDLVCLVLCRIANLSIEHGNTDASALGYAYLGMVLGPSFDDYAAGYRFGQVGLALVDQRSLTRFKARVYMTVAYHVMPWTQHFDAGTFGLLRRAFDAANEVGDLTYAGFSSCTLVTSLFARGVPLPEAQAEAETKLAFVKGAKFGLIVDIISAQRGLIRTLQGLTVGFGSFDDAGFNEAGFEAHLRQNPSLAIAACWYWIRKLQARFLAGDVAAAASAAAAAEPLMWTTLGHIELAEFHFYAALARAALVDATTGDEQRLHVEAVAGHQRHLQTWARNCPGNFGNRAALVGAELARISGRDLEAMRGYETAIESARQHGFVHHVALAHEVAARFYAMRGFGTTAGAYLHKARDGYAAWGAMAKVRQLDRQLPQPAPAPQEPVALARAPGLSELDVATVVKSSQAVSGEAGLEKLMETLMVIVLQHAGAERGLLILPRGDGWRIEAEATAGRDEVRVRLRGTVVAPQELPASIFQVVLRTAEPVLLGDAQTAADFLADPYVVQHRVRSALCVPLMKQAQLVGALYLENNLTPHAFTPARVAMLRLLASQAAMSLQNAALGEKEALLKEVHHRVKNNLQLITSLLNLQAARVADPAVAELFADSRNRVRAMALVHENLYRAGNLSSIPMARHLQSLCSHLNGAYGSPAHHVRLAVEVDDLHLEMDRAVPCGLIVNELVSNALKHAFPAGGTGTVRVALRAEATGRLTLEVADDGIGLPAELDIARSDTLGLRLVGDLAEQLHGRVVVSREGGTTVAVSFADRQHEQTQDHAQEPVR
jgi:predicted ATPase/two-component sensor histidine kinase